MSLLLDALKKAAQDKQKAAQEHSGHEVLHQNVTEETSLDFNLEQVETPAENAGTQDELPVISNEVKSPSADLHKPALPVVESIKRPAKIETLALEEIELQKKEIEKQVYVPVSGRDEQESVGARTKYVAPPTNSVKQQAALDVIINKSRQAHEKQKNIILAAGLIVVVFILGAAAAFFYVESGNKFKSQQAYIPASPNLNSVEVAVQNTEQEIVVQEVPAQVEKPVVKKSIKPSVSKPVQKQIVKEQQMPAVSFTRQVKSDPVEALLSKAYEKFNMGDYVAANELYGQVLKQERDNRDALIGEAAVAIKQQRNEYARQKYLQLLQLDPKDSIARAGLASVAADEKDETQLKLMLREQPEAAHLYFALGSLYASQQRWSEAQQAYFSAWTGDSSNADYAFNLGVSLDRMGKFKAAASQYQIALQLQQTRAGSFKSEDVESRIKAIENMTHE